MTQSDRETQKSVVVVAIPLRNAGRFTFIEKADEPLLQRCGRWHGHTITSSSGLEYTYARGRREGRRVKLHRLVAGAKSGEVVDHINGDTLDNRLANLRVCTHAENVRNGRLQKTRSGWPGVEQISGRYRVAVNVGGKIVRKTFADPQEAHLHFLELKKAMHGEFARTT